MIIEWGEIFDNFGVKKVTKTDINKDAYVLNKEQCIVIEAAGILAAKIRPCPKFDVTILFDAKVKNKKASYYKAERSKKEKRTPEPRMGIITSWLNVGDHIVIGNVGAQVFASKLQAVPLANEAITREVISRLNKQSVFDRAKKAAGKPMKKLVEHNDFVRNPYVVAAAILRSEGTCDMPGCSCVLFEKDDGTSYLEVHHIVPLAEDGDDTLTNAAAICPHCHRKLHYGKGREAYRMTLKTYIATLNVP